MRLSSIGATLLGLSSSAYAQSGYVSATQNGITYAFSVPDQTASSGSGDVYIKMSGPTSFSWIGMGSGSQMSGSKMFIIYTNSAGTNVTLSPRSGSGHNTPSVDSSAQATLVDGTGVSNGMMTAVIKCSSCASSFSITSSSANLIYAAKSGSAIKSDSASASIQQHDNTYGSMTMDMTKAKNSNNANPFGSGSSVATPTTGGSSGSAQSCVPISQASSGASATTSSGSGSGNGYPFGSGSRPTGRPPWATGTGFPFGGNNNNNNNNKRASAPSACPSGYVLSGDTSSNSGASFGNQGKSASNTRTMLIAHGIMAGLAFAVLFPFGAISIRLMNFPGLLWFHAALQIFAYVFYIIAFGLGVYIASNGGYMSEAHPVIGILLFVVIFFMPIFGWMHHSNFKKFQQRTLPSFAHIWLGRIIIPLGIINGGLGFALADNTRTGPIAYGVVAGVFFLVYIVAIVIGERRRAKNTSRGSPPKYDEVLLENSPRHSPTGSPQRHREFYGQGRK